MTRTKTAAQSLDTAAAEKRVASLTKKREKYMSLAAEKAKYTNALTREKEHSAFKKAASLFRFPFGKAAFARIGDASSFLWGTIFFAGVACFVWFGAFLCVIADLVYILLFGVCYPVVLLFYLFFRPLRVRRFSGRLQELEKALRPYDIHAIERELAELKSVVAASRPREKRAGVEDTEWYQEKADEEYRRLMNLPPKKKGLSNLSTDTTLDMHPGDH